MNDNCIHNAGSSIIGVSYNMTNFTLSCVTSHGIATYINDDGCNSNKQVVSFSQYVLDPQTMRYNNILKWHSQDQSNYICSTRSSVTTSYAVLLTEFGFGKSLNIIALLDHHFIK